ncbi:MAG: aspartyl-phosphate phosphatase Spo0E family protein [Bacillota bacterium]|nr:aspartyl-phosphate phosphatase Spo0E family protein [Bacillota bacterium]
MPGKDGSAQLIIEITNLKKDLSLAYKKRKSLIHPEIVAISMQLDVKIVQYTKMKNNKPENGELSDTVLTESKKGK